MAAACLEHTFWGCRGCRGCVQYANAQLRWWHIHGIQVAWLCLRRFSLLPILSVIQKTPETKLFFFVCLWNVIQHLNMEPFLFLNFELVGVYSRQTGVAKRANRGLEWRRVTWGQGHTQWPLTDRSKVRLTWVWAHQQYFLSVLNANTSDTSKIQMTLFYLHWNKQLIISGLLSTECCAYQENLSKISLHVTWQNTWQNRARYKLPVVFSVVIISILA